MNLSPVLRQRYFDTNGDPLAGGKLYTYQAGTTTLQPTYTDADGVTPNANPIVLDANGEASMWLDPDLSYKFVLKDANDVTQWTVDGVLGLLAVNAVNTESIQDGAVTAEKLADGSVTNAKLGSSASIDADRPVGTDNIKDSVVTRAKLAAGAVGKLTVVSKAAAYTATSSDDAILVSAGAGAVTITLPTAVGIDGKRYWIKKTDSSANAVTVDANSTETIDGSLIRVLRSQYDAVQIASDGTNWIVISPMTIQSRIEVQTGNGHGSTNTRIRRFTTTNVNTGTDITYADSAANGASFTINTTGVYIITYIDFDTDGMSFGVSKNSAQLTTSYDAITDKLLTGGSPSGLAGVATGLVNLTAGDVLRAHTDGTTVSTRIDVKFMIAKIQ